MQRLVRCDSNFRLKLDKFRSREQIVDWLCDLVVAAVLTYFLKRTLTVIQAMQGYSLLKFRSPRKWENHDLLCGAFLLFSLSMFIWLGPEKSVIDLVAMTMAAVLLFQHLFPRVHMREHGIEMGTMFVPWNNIAKYGWSSAIAGYSALTMEGPWVFRKYVVVPEERKEIAHGVISGAARLEPETQERFAILTLARILGWGGCAVLICVLQQLG